MLRPDTRRDLGRRRARGLRRRPPRPCHPRHRDLPHGWVEAADGPGRNLRRATCARTRCRRPFWCSRCRPCPSMSSCGSSSWDRTRRGSRSATGSWSTPAARPDRGLRAHGIPVAEGNSMIIIHTVDPLPVDSKGMALWRKHIFAFLMRNARQPQLVLTVPQDMIMEWTTLMRFPRDLSPRSVGGLVAGRMPGSDDVIVSRPRVGSAPFADEAVVLELRRDRRTAASRVACQCSSASPSVEPDLSRRKRRGARRCGRPGRAAPGTSPATLGRG